MIDLRFEPVTKDNLSVAIQIQHDIFSHDDGSENLKASVNKKLFDKYYKGLHDLLCYWIVFDKKSPLGITGLYSYIDYPKEAWLSWFGVSQKYKRKGYGSRILNWTKAEALRRGYQNLRLYTCPNEDLEASPFYKFLGMIEEKYTTENDFYPHVVSIFSTSLTKQPFEKWNNKNLYLSQQHYLEQMNKIKNEI